MKTKDPFMQQKISDYATFNGIKTLKNATVSSIVVNRIDRSATNTSVLSAKAKRAYKILQIQQVEADMASKRKSFD